MAASSKDLTVALIVVGIVFFYRLNALALSMTRYYESHTNKSRRSSPRRFGCQTGWNMTLKRNTIEIK
jgi:hypothetical protein